MERINRGDYIALVCSLLGKGEAVVLTGHRRAGKSCILELLAAELATDGHVIYIVGRTCATCRCSTIWPALWPTTAERCSRPTALPNI